MQAGWMSVQTEEPDGLCGNQTLSSLAPDDGHNGVRNMLSLT